MRSIDLLLGEEHRRGNVIGTRDDDDKVRLQEWRLVNLNYFEEMIRETVDEPPSLSPVDDMTKNNLGFILDYEITTFTKLDRRHLKRKRSIQSTPQKKFSARKHFRPRLNSIPNSIQQTIFLFHPSPQYLVMFHKPLLNLCHETDQCKKKTQGKKICITS